MKHAEILRFSLILEDGIQKEAFMRGVGGMMRGAGEALGRGAFNAQDATQWMGQGIGRGAHAFGNFMTKERHLPTPGFIPAVRKGYNQAWNAEHTNASGMMHGPALKNPMPEVRPQTPMNPALGTSQTNAQGWGPSWSQFAPNEAKNMRAAHQNKGFTPPTGAPAADAREWAGAGSAALPAGALQPTGNGYADKFKAFWGARSLPQKIGLGYGAATAANAPFTYSNNAHADWQQQHPIMSWAGQTFAGMPKYNEHTYLLPGMLQR